MSAPLQLLQIEDNETDAFLEIRELKRSGFQVEATRVDTEADLRVALSTRSWDLVLCDFTLPGFSGAEALRIAKELSPDTPFIFVSGTIGEAAIVDAMRSGARDYVMKDRLTRLSPAVSRELREAAVRRESLLNERGMRESEHKYRQLFDALSDAVFLIEEGAGRVIDTNRQAEHLLHRERRDLVGRNHRALFASPTDVPVLAELRAAASSPDRGGCVLHLLKPGEAPMPVHASASRIELYGRSLLLVLMHVRARRSVVRPPRESDAEQILAEVSRWPREAVADLIRRISALHPSDARNEPAF